MKVSNDNRKNIIKSLMKPLQKKYKMKSLQDMSINTIIIVMMWTSILKNLEKIIIHQ